MGRLRETAWHRNQGKQRQRDRGLLAAASLGWAAQLALASWAALRLDCRHDSSMGNMAPSGDHEWKWNRRMGPDGARWRNMAWRTHCHKCNVQKGKYNGRELAPNGGPARSMAVRQVAAQNPAQKQIQKLKLENE